MKIMKNFLTAIVFISLVAGSIQAAENNPERPPDLNLVNRDRPGQDRIDSENGEFRPREGRPGFTPNNPRRRNDSDRPPPFLTQNERLRSIIDRENLSGDPSTDRDLPEISSPVASLGKLLFFSTHLGGEQDTACVSCHHPVLGGADAISLSIGIHAVDAQNISDPALLGPGRHPEVAGGLPEVPRNSQSVFNLGMWDRGLFWDSRVARVRIDNEPGVDEATFAITTPDSDGFNEVDDTLPPGTSLAAAQARFPVTSGDEMRGDFLTGEDNQILRTRLAERFHDENGNWSALFEEAFGDSEITFDRIAEAIGEYERSMVFIDSPWKAFVEGDDDALSDQQKRGAVLFFTSRRQGGAACNRCHSGDLFSDGRHHAVGFPQISNDLGRESVSGRERDRYRFRTPSLMNVAVTAPFGHAGLYQTLEEVVHHYDNPRRSVAELFGEQDDVPFADTEAPFCRLPQIERIVDASGGVCENLFPDAFSNSMLALDEIRNNDRFRGPPQGGPPEGRPLREDPPPEFVADGD